MPPARELPRAERSTNQLGEYTQYNTSTVILIYNIPSRDCEKVACQDFPVGRRFAQGVVALANFIIGEPLKRGVQAETRQTFLTLICTSQR